MSLSRLLCLFGHRRSRGHARRTEAGFRSRCRRCGVAMHKLGEGRWEVDSDAVAAGAVAIVEAPRKRSRFARGKPAVRD